MELIPAVYPKSKGAGRPPLRMERMSRIHCLSHGSNLSDGAVRETLYEWCASREVLGIDLRRESVPDQTTTRKSRHPLEDHESDPQIFAAINADPSGQGFTVSAGSNVYAATISVPSSTDNHHGERDPEMYKANQGSEWHFGADGQQKPLYLEPTKGGRLMTAPAATG